MGMYWYFYKNDTDEEEFNTGKYSLPSYILDDLESVNYTNNNCEERIKYEIDNLNSIISCCFMCDCSNGARFKITRENAVYFSENLLSNKYLLLDLLDEINQNVMWANYW